MQQFFAKHGYPERELTGKHTLKMMKEKLKEAIKDYEEDEDYCKHLEQLDEYIRDFLYIKGIDLDDIGSPKRLT